MKAARAGGRVIRPEGTPEAAWNGWAGLSWLPPVDADALAPPGARVVVVAPHPDDEVLMVGGLLAQLARRRASVRVIAVTDGTASHPGSRVWTPRRLRHARPRETRAALRCLGIVEPPLRLGFDDGDLARQCGRIAQRLGGLIGPRDVVITTWRGDGHPDHEAVANACASAAARCRARLLEVPVWAWNWASPGDPRLPWRSAHRLALDEDARRRKCFAMQAYESQIAPDRSTGAGPVVGAVMLQRAARPFEVLFAPPG